VFALLKGRETKVGPGEEPTFTWFKSGQEFDPEGRFKVLFKDEEDTLALIFQHINPEDAGLYTCVASTSTGKISCSAELSVEGGVTQCLKVRNNFLLRHIMLRDELTLKCVNIKMVFGFGYPRACRFRKTKQTNQIWFLVRLIFFKT
jgi:hypothetical protein